MSRTEDAGGRRPRVLVFVNYFAPGYRGGGPTRSISNFIEFLHSDLDIWVVTSNRDYGAQETYADTEPGQWKPWQDQAMTYYVDSFARIPGLIRELQPDWVYLNNIYSLPFCLFPLALLKSWSGVQARVLLAPRGALEPAALKIKPLKKWIFLKFLNWTGLLSQIRFKASNSLEAEHIRSHFGDRAEIAIAPNLPPRSPQSVSSLPKVPGRLRLIYASRVTAKKNLHYLLERLANVKGEVSLEIVGDPDGHDYARKCQAMADRLPKNVEVSWTGAIPHHAVAERLQAAHLFVLATASENFGHAILESLLAGRPVLLSDQTPWRDLEREKAGWDLPLDRPELFEASLNEAVDWNQEQFQAWVEGSAAVGRRYQQAPENRLRHLELFR